MACGRRGADPHKSKAVLDEVFEGDPGGAFSKLFQLWNFGMGSEKVWNGLFQTFSNFEEVFTGFFFILKIFFV